MIIKLKELINSIVNKLFIENPNPLESMGISVSDISERVKKIKSGDKRDVENINNDINLALEFSEAISSEEKQELKKLKLELEANY